MTDLPTRLATDITNVLAAQAKGRGVELSPEVMTDLHGSIQEVLARSLPPFDHGLLPDCMMPDGADPCRAFSMFYGEFCKIRDERDALASDLEKVQTELDVATAQSRDTDRELGVLRSIERAFVDVCVKLGCAHDNEVALAAVVRLRAERDAMQLLLGNQLAMMGALHQLMRGFLAPDPLAQGRLTARIQATRALADLPGK